MSFISTLYKGKHLNSMKISITLSHEEIYNLQNRFTIPLTIYFCSVKVLYIVFNAICIMCFVLVIKRYGRRFTEHTHTYTRIYIHIYARFFYVITISFRLLLIMHYFGM